VMFDSVAVTFGSADCAPAETESNRKTKKSASPSAGG
jgi:hypothetical protein